MSKKKDVLQGSKCLITGYKGFIGSHLYKALENKGALVIGLDSESGGITNKQLLESMCKDVDYIFQLGAISSVPSCEQDSELAHETNVTGVFNILKASTLHRVKRFVFASSCVVFYPTSTMYAITKTIGETYCEFFEDKYKLPITGLRFYNVYGAGQSSNTAVIPSFIKQLKEGRLIVIEGDGKQVRDFVYIKDVVDAIIKVVEKDISGYFNIGTGQGISILDLAYMIANIMSKEAKFEFTEGRTGDIQGIVAFKPSWFNPKYTLEQGLTEIISEVENK
jgi:nucleoside-diphosphate-sugar epimerase